MKQQSDFSERKRVAVLFGGRSAEHEISIITALQAIGAMDTLRYDVIPVYIEPKGKWYTGKALLDKSIYRTFQSHISALQQVTLLPDPSIGGLLPIDNGFACLEKAIPVDLYFLQFHGQQGEDGCIQGLLELADAVYTGCGVLSSAVAMNKFHCKVFLKEEGIPSLPATTVRHDEVLENGLDAVRKRIMSTPGLGVFPLFVKPNNLGSSIGISKAHDADTLNAALAKGFRYDHTLIVEPCVQNLMEINVSIMAGLASVVEIPVATDGALTYEDKYLRGNNKSQGQAQGMASLSRIIDPSDLDPKIKNRVVEYALKAYSALGCLGVSRFDFILDLDSNKLYFNELNPVPGSNAFYLWHKTSPPLLYTHLIDHLIDQALSRKAEALSLQRSLGFKALTT